MQPNRPPGQRVIIILLCIIVATIFLTGTLYSQAEPVPKEQDTANDPNIILITATPTTSSGPTQPTLTVQGGLITFPEAYVSVPIHFNNGGISDINSMYFSLQFDPACLAFTPQDNTGDGLPDQVFFNRLLPPTVVKKVVLDELAAGRISIILAGSTVQTVLPSLSSLLSVTFQTNCTPAGAEQETTIALTDSSISSLTSQPLEARTFDGIITIRHWPTATPTFTPSPTPTLYGGCRAGTGRVEMTNGTDQIAAPACTMTASPTATPTPFSPTLSIPNNIWAWMYSRVTVPINYQTGNQAVAAMAFSIDYDQTCLVFDATDQDGDGIPDDIRFAALLNAFTISVSFDAADTDGELDFIIFDAAPP
ncbi:MAG: hypothetical protein KDE19_13450, partial [Caldilineaceae bacterium]|nr:hypothetical protein [Caldilineaceae bacterium]